MPGRNDPCPCGSGKKYKKCCANNAAQPRTATANVDPNMIMSYMNSGQWAAAIQTIQAYLPAEPNNPALYEMLAVAQYQSGLLQEAAENFQKQLQYSKKDPQAHNNLAQVLFDLGQNEQASLHCQRAIQLDKKFDAAHNCLGNIYRKARHLHDAEKSYQTAIKLNATNPLYFCNLGVVEQELGKYTDAEQHFLQALKLAPDFIQAMNNYAAVLQLQYKHEQAIEQYKHILSIEPENLETINNLGVCHMDMGELDEARKLFEKAIELDNGYIGAYINLGTIEIELNNLEKAKYFMEHALSRAPSDSDANQGLGSVLLKQESIEEAKQYIANSLKYNPNNSKALAAMSVIELNQSKYKSAYSLLEQAKSLSPNDHYIKSVEANYYESTSCFEKAESIWKDMLLDDATRRTGMWGLVSLYSESGKYDLMEEVFNDLIPENENMAYLRWAYIEEKRNNLDKARELLSKVKPDESTQFRYDMLGVVLERRNKNFAEAIAKLDEMELSEVEHLTARMGYYFEKGRCLDKYKRYPEAIECFKEGNKLRSKKFIGDSVNDNTYIEWQDFYTRERQRDWQFEAYQEKQKPIFIVGFPRSGTTLVEQILSSHSRVIPGDELVYITNMARFSAEATLSSDTKYPLCLDGITQDGVNSLRELYMDSARTNRVITEETEYFTDKMPHNLASLGLINLLFPDSPIIHVMRHPLDSCLSAFMSNFAKGHGYLRTLEDTARHFANLMRLGEYYKQHLDLNILTIRYEDIVDDQETNTHKLLDFAGLEWEDACLSFHKNKRVARTASYEQVTQKIYTSSRFRYKNYYEQLKSIFPILEETISYYGYTIEP